MTMSFDASKNIGRQCDALREAYTKRYEKYEMVLNELERVTSNLSAVVADFDELFDGSCGTHGKSGSFDDELESDTGSGKTTVISVVFDKIDHFEGCCKEGALYSLQQLRDSCKRGIEMLKDALEEGDLDVED